MFTNIEAKIGKETFPIIISNDAIKNLIYYLDNFKNKKNIIVADKIFLDLKYRPDNNITKILNKYPTFFCSGGIKNKSIKNLYKILKFLHKKNTNKDTNLIAIGGGVIGDMTGFAASIYKRGINLIHVPTTMTSMVDSCVGGKTGINEFNQVNLLGSYYQPNGIFIDPRFLETLKKRDFKSGLVESIKKSIIYSDNFFNFLLNNYKEINNINNSHVHRVITESIKIKLNLVQNDEKEKSTRLSLNYGHTFGQALESYYGINENYLTHGEAVSLGMICAAKLSKIFLKNDLIIKHKEILELYELPTSLSFINAVPKPSIQKLMTLINNDKKKKNERLRFIICDQIGSFEVVIPKNENQIKKSFEIIL